jgi:hypothetical protein
MSFPFGRLAAVRRLHGGGISPASQGPERHQSVGHRYQRVGSLERNGESRALTVTFIAVPCIGLHRTTEPASEFVRCPRSLYGLAELSLDSEKGAASAVAWTSISCPDPVIATFISTSAIESSS